MYPMSIFTSTDTPFCVTKPEEKKRKKNKNLVCNITSLIVLEFPFLDEFLTCVNL